MGRNEKTTGQGTKQKDKGDWKTGICTITSRETTEGESSQEGGELQESGNAGESEESQSGGNAGLSEESQNSGSEVMSEGAQQEETTGQSGEEAPVQPENSEQPENSASAWNVLKDWLVPMKVYAAEENMEGQTVEKALNDPEEAQKEETEGEQEEQKEERKKENTQQESYSRKR